MYTESCGWLVLGYSEKKTEVVKRFDTYIGQYLLPMH